MGRRGIHDVSVKVFQQKVIDYVEREEITWTEAAIRLGWKRADGGRRLKRRVGICPHYHAGKPYMAKHMTHETAKSLCNLLGLDPVDVGL